MTDLTEFLLARIAEDEAVAQFPPPGAPEWWTGRLAECEAKRRIVDAYRIRAASTNIPLFVHRAQGLLIALRHLGAVYADHPDYQPEWRP